MSAADGKLRAANLDIDAPPATSKRILLAIYGTQRRPRLVAWQHEKHARAYARRWWTVIADTAEQARAAIVRADDPNRAALDARAPLAARVVDCGRNTAGGPTMNPTRRSA